LSGRKGHVVDVEASRLLDFAFGYRHLGHNGLANVGLPDAYRNGAVGRDAFGVDQAHGDRAGPYGRRQVAAVAAPVDEGRVDGYLPEQVIDVVIGLAAA